jgi:hypothetical protein
MLLSLRFAPRFRRDASRIELTAHAGQLPLDQAVAEITVQSECSFDPDIVNAFLQLDHATLVDHPESLMSQSRYDHAPDPTR